MRKREIKVRGAQDITDVNVQMELFKSVFHLPETMAERYYIRRGKPLPNSKKPTYVLCKRERPISIYEDDSGAKRSITQSAKTYVERMGGMELKVDGLSRDTARAVVENQLCQSVEVGEVEPFCGM